MEKFNSLISDLELAIQNTKFYIKQNRGILSITSVILGCGTLATAVLLYTLPKWATIILLVLLWAYAIIEKSKYLSYISDKLAEIDKIIDKINHFLLETELSKKTSAIEEYQKKDDTIALLKSTVERLEGLIANNATKIEPVEVVSELSQSERNQAVLLKKLQTLDFEVEDFGEECSSYIRKEFSKALRTCGLEFVDYSENTKYMFAVETAAIDFIDCTARAIATLSSPKEVVLRGHAFIPEN